MKLLYPIQQKELTRSLSEFGLSPQEWLIQQENQYSYIIKNKQSPDFYFRGYTDRSAKKPRWHRLQLVGI